MRLQYIQDKIKQFQDYINQVEKKAYRYSLLRLGFFVFSCCLWYQGYEKQNGILYNIGAIICLGLFIWFVYLHRSCKKKIIEITALQQAYQDITLRKSDEWKTFEDTGVEFLSESNKQAYDLDIFGNASLFQYLNCTKTPFGRTYLASLLSCSKQNIDEIKQRQEAVQECSKLEAFTMQVVSTSKLFSNHQKKRKQEKLEEVLQYLETYKQTYPTWFRIIWYILSFYTLVCLVGVLCFQMNLAYFLIGAVLSLSLSFLFVMLNMQVLSPVAYSAQIMKEYQRFLTLIKSQEFQSDWMKYEQAQCKEALDAITKLERILQSIQARNNFLLHIVLNACCLIDFHCVYALEQWKLTYGKDVRRWLEAVGKIEAIVSLTQIDYAKESTCYPNIWKKSNMSIELQEMYHPLLLEQRAISNSFETTTQTYILTGSNMSGKTTFLRSIGLNMVLFHAGAAICASYATLSSMHIYTSMRVHDNVNEGISTFYAEILRIKEMMEASKNKEEMLVLIDEIFKGTNSADRILCATQAIRKLHQPWIFTMVSTHDFELCALENELDAKNYHFSEYYENDQIYFDYLLKEGRCTTTNAQALMKMAGF